MSSLCSAVALTRNRRNWSGLAFFYSTRSKHLYPSGTTHEVLFEFAWQDSSTPLATGQTYSTYGLSSHRAFGTHIANVKTMSTQPVPYVQIVFGIFARPCLQVSSRSCMGFYSRRHIARQWVPADFQFSLLASAWEIVGHATSLWEAAWVRNAQCKSFHAHVSA